MLKFDFLQPVFFLVFNRVQIVTRNKELFIQVNTRGVNRKYIAHIAQMIDYIVFSCKLIGEREVIA